MSSEQVEQSALAAIAPTCDPQVWPRSAGSEAQCRRLQSRRRSDGPQTQCRGQTWGQQVGFGGQIADFSLLAETPDPLAGLAAPLQSRLGRESSGF